MPSTFMFKRPVTLLAAGASLFASLNAFGQYNPNIQQNFQPNQNGNFQDWQSSVSGAAASSAAATAANTAAAYQNPAAQFLQSSAPASGYTNDGTLMMGGQKIGNPHQILHDLNVPSFFGVNANRLSYSDVPTYGQGTLAQMENHTLTIGVPAGNVVLSRLYVTPTNPYTQGVATPHNNYQTYQGVVADAQAASYQLTVANDSKLYAFKTLGAMSTQTQNILIKELPAHSVFIANSDPKGGAVAVRVTQSGDAVAMQNYLATVKPYDFSWRAALAPMANAPNTGAFVANWVMGSHQVQTYQADLQNQSMQTGNEAFGVLAWDANQNKYVMLDPTNQQATAGSVSGNMPTLGNNQFGFFGMHTHPGSATPSEQDLRMTQQLGLDQMVIGTNGAQAIFTNNPSNNWQGTGFEFEGYNDGKKPADKRTTVAVYGGVEGTYGVGGKVSGGQYAVVDGNYQVVETGQFISPAFTAGYSVKGTATGVSITEGGSDIFSGGNWSVSGSFGLWNAAFGGSFSLDPINTIAAGGGAGTGASLGLGWTWLRVDGSINPATGEQAVSILSTSSSSSSYSGSGSFSTQAGTGGGYVQTGQYGVPTGGTYSL